MSKQIEMEYLAGRDLSYYRRKKVLVTGHNGFKGSWLTFWLNKLGAEVYGYSLTPPPAELDESLCHVINLSQDIAGEKHADVCWYNVLEDYFKQVQPDVVFHLAAQPIVSEGYRCPRSTFETNVMGTVNVLECIRRTPSVKSAVIITTDKVYDYEMVPVDGYRETDPLGGFDPYSNSKSCADLAAQCYCNSFFADRDIDVSIFRAGNVIGGGDFAKNRIVPDFFRALRDGRTLHLRNPEAIRPYQHVLEPLYAYLCAGIPSGSGCDTFNVGPRVVDCATTARLVEALFDEVGMPYNVDKVEGHMIEAELLTLNTNKIFKKGILPRLDFDTTVSRTAEWYASYLNDPKDTTRLRRIMSQQIDEYYAKVVLGWIAE